MNLSLSSRFFLGPIVWRKKPIDILHMSRTQDTLLSVLHGEGGGGGGTALYSSGGGCYIGLKRKNEKREIDSHKPVPVLMTLAKADIQAVAAAVEVSCATDAHAQSVSALVNYWPTTRRVSFTECFNN